jgi:glucose-6-phosphate 1-epimerase
MHPRFGPCIRLFGSDDSSVLVALHGAQVVSWIDAGGHELLFVSSLARSGGAIRGGVPVCFPQFASQGPLPKHGYARTSSWRHRGAGQFVLDVAPGTWPGFQYPCALMIDVQLGPRTLTIALTIDNVGTHELPFTAALHTYLAVPSLVVSRVDGLLDEPILFEQEVDLHVRTITQPALLSVDGEPQMLCTQTGFPDAVVWNIGAAKASELTDLGIGEFDHYVCIEAALLSESLVQPGGRWVGSQTLVRL